jgi:hypothetical protein
MAIEGWRIDSVYFGSRLGTGPTDQAFYLAGRNSTPEAASYLAPPTNPFSSANAKEATRYRGSSVLQVRFTERITTEPGKTPPPAVRDILGQGDAYTLLPCDNDLLPLGVSEDAYRNAANPEAVKKAIESGLGEIATLMKPVFHQDNRHTFFVEPSVSERTIEEWQEWVTKTPGAEPWRPEYPWWKDIVMVPAIPWKGPLPDPGDPWRFAVDPAARITPALDRDWLINPATVLAFDNVLIGPAGQPGVEVVTRGDQAALGGHINVNPGSEVAGMVVVSAQHTFGRSGLAAAGGGLNIVGRSGLNAALAQNLNQLNRSGFGAGVTGVGRLER